jgi:hypothetical protein
VLMAVSTTIVKSSTNIVDFSRPLQDSLCFRANLRITCDINQNCPHHRVGSLGNWGFISFLPGASVDSSCCQSFLMLLSRRRAERPSKTSPVSFFVWFQATVSHFCLVADSRPSRGMYTRWQWIASWIPDQHLCGGRHKTWKILKYIKRKRNST